MRNLGLTSSVKFLGIRSDIPKLMQAMDIFLFPSLFEGLPVVLVEAQAAGLKCIVSNTITRESDITGRVDFLSLKQSTKEWAEQIFLSKFEREDTKEKIRESGYDSITNAKWLSEYYSNYYEFASN